MREKRFGQNKRALNKQGSFILNDINFMIL
jgi:hypothetical protein